MNVVPNEVYCAVLLFCTVGLTEAHIMGWSVREPGREQSRRSMDIVRGLVLPDYSGAADSSGAGTRDDRRQPDWKAILRSRKLWAALAIETSLGEGIQR